MATPASSATSPSPPMPYLSHGPVSTQSSLCAPFDPHELEMRKKAVQKFLARAEISMVTRALRARLSYASYKATHNVPHVPLRELEGQLASQNQAASSNRTITAKRKPAGASASHFSSASISPSLATGAGASATRRGGSSSMPPPVSASSPRVHHSTLAGSSTGAGNKSTAASNKGSTTNMPNLYTSILAPPTKAARTVHNANGPPGSRPVPSPRVRSVKASPKSVADGSRTHSKAKQPDKKTVASPERRKTKRASLEKGKGKQRQSTDLDADGDIAMKAAATLTSLLLNHRSSIAGSVSSPRSSMDGSETGSTYSYSHFAQSSARSTTAASPPVSISSTSTMTAPESSYRQQTPPPGPLPVNVQHTTPRPAPTDNEAADLMLFLATSPSPARPTPKPRDPTTYRSLGNDPSALRSKGRILFPSPSTGDIPMLDDPSLTNARGPTTLVRVGDGTYALSTSSTGTDAGPRNNGDMQAQRTSSLLTPGQLLPPPSLPPSSRMPESPVRKDTTQSPKLLYGSGTSDFNFSEFINASPSPSRGPTHKPNLSLRADVGRKLFEEEQMRHSTNLTQAPGKRHDERSLGDEIDISQGLEGQ